jgi:glutaredoxin 3
MGLAGSTSRAASNMAGGLSLDAVIASNKLVVVSKSHCPYCQKVLRLLQGEPYKAQVVVLDAVAEPAYQARALELTGQRTVPNVFINGKSVGGCDSTVALHNSGKLRELLS